MILTSWITTVANRIRNASARRRLSRKYRGNRYARPAGVMGSSTSYARPSGDIRESLWHTFDVTPRFHRDSRRFQRQVWNTSDVATMTERLEDRTLLTYSATLAAGVVTFTGDTAGDTLTFTTDGGGLLEHNRGGTGGFNSNIDIDSATAGDQTVLVSNVTSLTVNAGGGNDTIELLATLTGLTGDVTINGEADSDTVNLNADITFASGESLIVNAETLNTGASADLATSGAGVITITADDVALDVTSTLVSASTVTLKPQTASRVINLGTATGGLDLTDDELDNITAGTLQIGDGSSGTITVSAAINHDNNLSLTTGAGVTFNNAVTMAVDKNLTVSALGTTNGTINLSGSSSDLISSGTGAISLTTVRNIPLASGSSITTVNGGITLSANATGATTGNFVGLQADNAILQTSGTGNISLTGRGANNSNANPNQHGVYLLNGTSVSSTATGATAGTITIVGTGGTGTSVNMGVFLNGSTTDVTSVDGDIAITGTGGNGSGGGNYGVNMQGDATVQVTNAAMQITGTAGASTSDGFGVRLSQSSGGRLLSVGSGSITVTATGNGAVADFRAGSDSRIGFDGTTATTGNIEINANSIQWDGSLMNVRSDGALLIQPRTAST